MKLRFFDNNSQNLRPAFFLKVALILLVPLVHAAPKDPGFPWRPIEALSEEARAVQSSVRILPILVTPTPKSTADMSKYTKKHVLDLKAFAIYNDGTHAEETSKGINAALQHAKTLGANLIIFPKGTYLISELDPILFDHKDTIIDLNGATLQINPNGLQKYSTVRIVFGAENFRLTNGTLRGDKDTHDYTAGGEWGAGLIFVSGRNLEVDNMVFTNFMGDGVASETGARDRRTHGGYYNLAIKNLEQGAFSLKGERVVSDQKTRTIEPYDMSNFAGEFEIGYIYGYACFPAVTDRNYQAYFFDKDMTFVAKRDFIQFRKNAIPQGATFMHLELNQPSVLGAKTENFCVAICNLRPSIDVHFHHNHLIANRRLGMAFCGGQRWVIEDNLFEANGGAAPGYGIDFEDGWDLMQDVVFRNNRFKDNKAGDMVVCAGSEMLFEGNVFEKNVVVWGRLHNYTFKNNRVRGGVAAFSSRTGAATLTDNVFENCKVSIEYDNNDVDDGIYTLHDGPAGTSPPVFARNIFTNIRDLTGTYFPFTDSTFKNVKLTAGKTTELASFKTCTFEDTSLEFQATGPDVQVIIEDCKGTLEQKGPGRDRVTKSGMTGANVSL